MNEAAKRAAARRSAEIEAVLGEYLPREAGAEWVEKAFFADEADCEDAEVADRAASVAECLCGEGNLLDPCRSLLASGGKRWRPLLAYLVCESLGGGNSALPLAALVEFCHNASLIHDDIEDSSPLRRGKPSAHISFGLDTALNSGSFLYFLPLMCIDRWSGGQEEKAALFRLWGEYMRRLHLGQSLDICWKRRPLRDGIPTQALYETMCALKTGVLSRFACKTGVFAAKTALNSLKSEKNTHVAVEKAQVVSENALCKAAEDMGVAFQILDDVKNLSGGVKGKAYGDDVAEGKRSLPLILFLKDGQEKRERARRLALVEECFTAAARDGVSSPSVARLCAAFAEAGVLGEAASRGQQLAARAESVFSRLETTASPPCREAASLLRQLPASLLR